MLVDFLSLSNVFNKLKITTWLRIKVLSTNQKACFKLAFEVPQRGFGPFGFHPRIRFWAGLRRTSTSSPSWIFEALFFVSKYDANVLILVHGLCGWWANLVSKVLGYGHLGRRGRRHPAEAWFWVTQWGWARMKSRRQYLDRDQHDALMSLSTNKAAVHS